MIANQEPERLPSRVAALYLEHHDRLFRAAYRIVGNATDADDVLQTVFLRLASRQGELMAVENPASYLYRAAINTAVDLLRARREGQILPLTAVEDSREGSQSAPDEDHGLRARLREALARLSPRWAEMFVLKHIEGCDNGEIARLCGTSQAVVAVTLFRARARLKTELAEQMGGAL